jgi:primosomal protein N' (replication factor Y)
MGSIALPARVRPGWRGSLVWQVVQEGVSGLPPAGQLVVLRTDCPDAAYGEHFLQTLRERATAHLPAQARLIGPLPSPMHRRAGKYRCQLLLMAPHRKAAQAAASLLVTIAEGLPSRYGMKWTIDIDPQDVY